MSLNQRSLWHRTHQQEEILSATPTRLELVTEQTCDLELCTAETLRRTQQELQWYRQLYENTPVVYFSLDAMGIISSVNQFGANCLGYTPEKLINQPVFHLFDQSDQQRLSDAFIDILRAAPQSTVNYGEFRLNCPSSRIAWIKITLRILFGVNDTYKNSVILMVCEDITAHKQTECKLAEIALKQSQEAALAQFEEIEGLSRLKEEFLSTVSHELRTPLTNMKMAIQMLGIALHQEQNFLWEMAKPLTERSKAARYFEILDNECDREINLINNFLDLQRLDTSAKPWVLETIQVQQWLWRVVELFKARNPNFCKQNLHLSIAVNLPTIACDPFSLERILIELLTNACKFSPADAEITISAQLKGHNIQFQVINSGVEIPSSELPYIFNKFYRIPSNDPWKQGGTGLGLALVEKLTKHLGGTIEVASESNCTCFSLQLALSGQPRG
ncbi:PAS domain S-box protein [Nostocaceae cyanobacterium CENA357]|uniref:histidine kinase n=1 Tax=Atlanticothrix silvestris CENA357 TaxID=1725252 RepID=A0A8J7L710_9CYAN|nr:PAS domain-containing sensor histidine kinase [Atlanticothrix silvestris]MBH8556277.1 PAS domain S-box protein [Atlanticothrix silvestris CENA357]